MYYTGDKDRKRRRARIHPSRFKLRQRALPDLAALILRLLPSCCAPCNTRCTIEGVARRPPTDGLKTCITRLRLGALDFGSTYSRIVHLVIQGGQLKKPPTDVLRSCNTRLSSGALDFGSITGPSVTPPDGSSPATHRL